MKVKCISRGCYIYLVVGQEYEAKDNGSFYVINPFSINGEEYYYEKGIFEIVPESALTTLSIKVDASTALQQVKELTEALTALDVAYSNVKHLLDFKGE